MSSSAAAVMNNLSSQKQNDFEPPGSLLLLQTLLYFDWWYTLLLFVMTGGLFVFKLYALPYPQGYFSIEIVILLIYLGLALQRISYGMKGNKIESAKYIWMMFIMTVFCAFCNAYFISSQSYILKIEVLLQGIALIFALLEVVLGMFGICIYNKD